MAKAPIGGSLAQRRGRRQHFNIVVDGIERGQNYNYSDIIDVRRSLTTRRSAGNRGRKKCGGEAEGRANQMKFDIFCKRPAKLGTQGDRNIYLGG